MARKIMISEDLVHFCKDNEERNILQQMVGRTWTRYADVINDIEGISNVKDLQNLIIRVKLRKKKHKEEIKNMKRGRQRKYIVTKEWITFCKNSKERDIVAAMIVHEMNSKKVSEALNIDVQTINNKLTTIRRRMEKNGSNVANSKNPKSETSSPNHNSEVTSIPIVKNQKTKKTIWTRLKQFLFGA